VKGKEKNLLPFFLSLSLSLSLLPLGLERRGVHAHHPFEPVPARRGRHGVGRPLPQRRERVSVHFDGRFGLNFRDVVEPFRFRESLHFRGQQGPPFRVGVGQRAAGLLLGLLEQRRQRGLEVRVVARQLRQRLAEVSAGRLEPEGDEGGLELGLVGDSGLALEGLDVGGEFLDGGRVARERDGDRLFELG